MTGKMDEKGTDTEPRGRRTTSAHNTDKYEVQAFAGLTSGLPAKTIPNDFK